MARPNLLLFLPLVVAGGLGILSWQTLAGRQAMEDAGSDPSALPSMLVGKEAAPVAVTAMEGLPSFTDADLRDGKVKIVNFWASWCAPCRAEHPNLKGLSEAGVRILGVNYKDDPAAAKKFLAELGNPYAAVGADASGRMGLDWGLYGVPESFIIDGNGKVIMRFPGPITERVLDSDIRPALAKAAGG